jgi:hypothetical protein
MTGVVQSAQVVVWDKMKKPDFRISPLPRQLGYFDIVPEMVGIRVADDYETELFQEVRWQC